MEQTVLLFSFLLSMLLLSIMGGFALRRGDKSNSSSKSSPQAPLPPGPLELPIIGHLHHLVASREPQHVTFRNLASRHGPLILLRLGQVNYAVVSSREAAEEILRTHDLCFASRPKLSFLESFTYGYREISFAPYGPSWRLLRKICISELFTAKRVASFAPIREQTVSALVEEIASESAAGAIEINLKQKLQSLTNTILTKAAFTRECHPGQRQEFLGIMNDVQQSLSGLSLLDVFPSLKFIDGFIGINARIKRHMKSLNVILNEIIAEHENRLRLNMEKAIEGEEATGLPVDLMDILIMARNEEESKHDSNLITTETVKAVALELFFAGTDTSSNTLHWAMAELMKNPEAMKKAQREVRLAAKGKRLLVEGDLSELNYLKQIIKETLRLHPPIPFLLPRLCRETCNVQGYRVPAGTRVFVNVWALGRESQYWDDPEKFIPERFDKMEKSSAPVDFKGANYEFLPFGAGRRICPGMNFGVANVELPLAQLLHCFDWELPYGQKHEELDMHEAFGATLDKKVELRLRATPHFQDLVN